LGPAHSGLVVQVCLSKSVSRSTTARTPCPIPDSSVSNRWPAASDRCPGSNAGRRKTGRRHRYKRECLDLRKTILLLHTTVVAGTTDFRGQRTARQPVATRQSLNRGFVEA